MYWLSSTKCGNIISFCNSGDNGQSLNGYAAQSRELLGNDFIKCFLVRASQASQVALVVKNLPANTGDIRDVGLILGQEDLLEEGDPLQYSCLENPVDRGAW